MRRFILFLTITLSLLTGAMLMLPQSVSAQADTGLNEIGNTVKLSNTDPITIAANIINVALGLLGIILVSLLVYAGFLYMTSGGDAEKISKAKKIIASSIIGLVIILSSWAIARYILEKFTEASQGGTSGGDGGGQYQLGGGQGSTGFKVISASPQGFVESPYLVPAIGFNRAVDASSVFNIIFVKVSDNSVVPGKYTVKNSMVTFLPDKPCLSPDEDLTCFDIKSDFLVRVGASTRSAEGASLGLDYVFKFSTGEKVDRQGPTVYMTEPFNSVPSESEVLIKATAKDDGGISHMSFFDNQEPLGDAGPTDPQTPKAYNGEASWSTYNIPLLSVRALSVNAFDISGHETKSSDNRVIVRSFLCFNGEKDEGEDDPFDCGGDPSSPNYCGSCDGSSCVEDTDCHGNSSCVNGFCVAKPMIAGINPASGKRGTFMTISGYNFGTSGSVKFLGADGPADDVLAFAPAICADNGMSTWSPKEVIVAVPEGASNGPIEIVNGNNELSDRTNDAVGPEVSPFEVNDVSHPGLCGASPKSGLPSEKFQVIGQGFGTSPSKMEFGFKTLTSFSSWSDSAIEAIVPVIGTGENSIFVKVGEEVSNPASYLVLSKISAGPPSIDTIDPVNGPKGEYVTIRGKNLGDKPGTIEFVNLTTEKQAMGDVAFPAACANSYWSDTQIIVKVPSKFDIEAEGAISAGDYNVQITRKEDLAKSNTIRFVVTDDQVRPGICAMVPALGPEGTAVAIYGEGFTSAIQSLYFSSGKAAVSSEWKNSEIKTYVPDSSVTGPVTVVTEKTSNGFNFQVKNCNEEAGICGLSVCCADGACYPAGYKCSVPPPESRFAWQSSTGLIPVAPRVIEECNPNKVPPPSPIPSPSPWIKRTGGDQVCTSASIAVRFTTNLDPLTVTAGNFKLKKCTGTAGDVCSAVQDVILNAGNVVAGIPPSPFLQQAGTNQDAVFMNAQSSLEKNTTYLVEITTGVRGDGVGGANMEQSNECGAGIAYCFRFKTRDSDATCQVGQVVVAPSPYTLNGEGDELPYLAAPLADNDKCVVLDCSSFNWDWYAGEKAVQPDIHAEFKTPLAPGIDSGTISCHQTGIAKSETGDTPVHMWATILAGGSQLKEVPGFADLKVNFIPPHVVDYAPKCEQACINALIWAKFSSTLDPDFVNAENVEVRQCANENCLSSDWGEPLALTSVKLTAGFGVETELKYIEIEPVSNLLPGKFYRVLLKGGTSTGIRGSNQVPMSELNAPEGFAWIFRTLVGEQAFCTADRVTVSPSEKFETQIDGRQLFSATPFSSADECSSAGQALIQAGGAAWGFAPNADLSVANYFFGGTLDTGGVLSDRCSSQCLAMGSRGEYGKIAKCGNGIVETAEKDFCANIYKGSAGCNYLSSAPAGEECEPSADGTLCDPNTCLWKPITQIGEGGTCGNKTLQKGEACDFGAFCYGSATVADGTECNSTVAKEACLKDGGTCAPVQYRGCTPFCRHAGSTLGKSTCGNSDIADGEDCDDGNLSNADSCSSQCLHTGSKKDIASVCGNAILEDGETCEKATLAGAFPAGCDTKSCLHIGSALCDNVASTIDTNCCGNGTIDSGEDCDEQDKNAGDGCSMTCLLEGSSYKYAKPSFCSNGVLEVGEQCETGLPSNHASLLTSANNASRKDIEADIKGTGKGDQKVDKLQLAYILGQSSNLDAQGRMSTILSVLLEAKTGTATYGLQCGFSSENACTGKRGLTNQGCCSDRPTIIAKTPQGTNVCRNALISVKFNTDMDASSVINNFQFARNTFSDTCPAGTTKVVDDNAPIKSGAGAWFGRAWKKLVAWVTGGPVYATIWCEGSVPGTLAVATSTNSAEFVFNLVNAMEKNTTYKIRFKGDLELNDGVKDGIRSAKGVVASGHQEWEFTTSETICAMNAVEVVDLSKEHPLLFLKSGEQHLFKATALSVQHGQAQAIAPVGEYMFAYGTWLSSDKTNTTFQVSAFGANATGQSGAVSGNEFISSYVSVFKDDVFIPSTQGSFVVGSAPVSIMVCENPWPSRTDAPIAPFRDKAPLASNGLDSSLQGSIFEKGPYYNFSTTYCRDSGEEGFADDLPKLEINYLPVTPTDANDSILRQYFFSYGNDNPGLKKDGIGIRILANPSHLSPEDWYKARGFTGQPTSMIVDGYRAIKDGTTTYVAAANTDAPGQAIYSNIYLISHNPDATPVTVNIYNQMVQNLGFNINLTKGISNICLQGTDPNVYTSAPFLTSSSDTVACSSDFDCLKKDENTHCGSFKLKLARDSVRISDFQVISSALEKVRQSTGTYPKLDGGSYIRGFSNSRWPSWKESLATEAGVSLPADPVNAFITCGRCTKSQTACLSNADCAKDDGCVSQSVNGANYDPSTCWDAEKRQYLCPKIFSSPSRMYQYRSINGGQRFELASEFEIPKPAVSGGWWTPSLIKEVQSCVNSETFGISCLSDSDCRIASDKPIIAGSCKPAGGRFIYSDICSNMPYGQSGMCGDGIVGGSEVCEIGETKATDCKTDKGISGSKLQVCDECKGFADDINITKCDDGILCGNGRVDKKCAAGTRSGLFCKENSECPSSICIATTEVCDDGALNGKYGYCNNTCNGYGGYCGDEKLAPGEICDEGLIGNGAYCAGNCVNTCSLDCKGIAPYCGDGKIDQPNETCDGQTITTELALCTNAGAKGQPCATNSDCGNNGACGTTATTKACTDTQSRCATSLKQCFLPGATSKGTVSNNIVCQEDSDCTGGKVCRSLQEFSCTKGNDEECSYPNIPGKCLEYPTAHVRTCNAPSAANQCKYADWTACKVLHFCGDGIIDASGEECDDGADNGNNKACTSSCKKNVCGDGKTFLNVEECDNGTENGKITCSADYASSCASCSNKCKFMASSGGYCGDKVKNGGEQCDGSEAVPSLDKQFLSCPFVTSKKFLCDNYLNAACLQSPCQKTVETGVTCKSLGYDFATNGMKPELIALDPALDIENYKSTPNEVCPAGADCSTKKITYCSEMDGMMEYQRIAFEACLGIKCEVVSEEVGSIETFAGKYIEPEVLPSANDFWKCVREKGPALGVGITTKDSPELLQCGLSCGFTGCGKCSDESGTAVIKGQLVDAVYNQVVPFAKLSLKYKGVLVSQTSSDADGKFEFFNLNDRPDCAFYKLIVDKYDDNPCTGNDGRPNCNLPSSPTWNYSYNVKEDERGGYWPLTTPTFTVRTFADMADQITNDGLPMLYVFPRPGIGDGYLTVLWNGWDGEYHRGGYNNHVVMPLTYTAPSEDDRANESFEPTSCEYGKASVIDGVTRACARDITWHSALKGYEDLSKKPHAYLTCLHKAGDKVGNLSKNKKYSGCPVEGSVACFQANGLDYEKCSRNNEDDVNPKLIEAQQVCSGYLDMPCLDEGETYVEGSGKITPALCLQKGGVCSPVCPKQYWDSCNFYKDGPLTTYFRYSAYSGSESPIKLFWNSDNKKSIHSIYNNSTLWLQNHLKNYSYKAVVSTDKAIVTIDSKDLTEECGKDCKFWHIANIVPKLGAIVGKNALRKERNTENFTDGIATYENDFQGGGSKAGYCVASGDDVTLYKQCDEDDATESPTDCVNPLKELSCKFLTETDYNRWEKANY